MYLLVFGCLLLGLKVCSIFSTGLEEECLYREAMANDCNVSLSYARILALGPGQVGKSTFLYRLTGIMKGSIIAADPKELPQSSTGSTELHEAYVSYTGALCDDWQVFDEESDLQYQLEGLVYLLFEQTSTNIAPQYSEQFVENDSNAVITAVTSSLVEPHQAAQAGEEVSGEEHGGNISEFSLSSLVDVSVNSCSQPQKSNIDRVLEEFEELQAKSKLAPNRIKFHTLFNIADVGGQPAFLEMLPSLTIGPALYLIFMKLLQGIKTRYPVAFKCKDGKEPKLCKNYTYTSEEVIFNALSSIACFGHSDDEVEAYITNRGDSKRTSSLALFIGTFADKIVNESELDNIDAQLKQHLEMTDFVDELVHTKKFLHVNNYDADDTEIKEHRKLLEDIIEKRFCKYEIPARWLVLSICIKLLARIEGRYEVSFDDCAKLGGCLGMRADMVRVALQFLHKYIGLVMYFPQHIHLKNVVICDPQVVFSSISELIFDIYDPRNLHITEERRDHFVQTGCFSPQDIRAIDEAQLKEKKLLSISTLINLLVHLNIVAEVPSDLAAEANSVPQSKEKSASAGAESLPIKHYYFFPAVLQSAEPAIWSRDVHLPEPLFVRFCTGYIPLGFVCALSANFLAESTFKLIPFSHENKMITYKNMIRFRFWGKFDILMISGLKYIEFRVTKCSGTMQFCECCPQIRTIICKAVEKVIQSMQHGSLYKLSKAKYDLAFRCPEHPTAEIGHEPLAKIVYDDSFSTSGADVHPKEIECVHSTCCIANALSPQMTMWFGQVRLKLPIILFLIMVIHFILDN